MPWSLPVRVLLTSCCEVMAVGVSWRNTGREKVAEPARGFGVLEVLTRLKRGTRARRGIMPELDFLEQ
jgi:hypothetical protein